MKTRSPLPRVSLRAALLAVALSLGLAAPAPAAAARADGRPPLPRAAATALSRPAWAEPPVAFSLRRFFSGTMSRTRVVQVAVVAMAIGLMILLKK